MFQLKEYNAIVNLIHRLLLTMDAHDAHGFASLFVEEDGQLEVTMVGSKSVGYQELKSWCMAINDRFGMCTHWEGNVIIEGTEDGMATNLSYWKALNGGECISTGIHRDVFVKVNGEWKVKRRIVEHTWTKGAGWVKSSADAPKNVK